MDGLLVKVDTPRMPKGGVDGRAGCDIVLVIDVSDSMGQDAPVPGGDTEGFGLSVLDLTKHAARAILATLDHRDRLGIVTFSTDAIPTIYTQLSRFLHRTGLKLGHAIHIVRV